VDQSLTDGIVTEPHGWRTGSARSDRLDTYTASKAAAKAKVPDQGSTYRGSCSDPGKALLGRRVESPVS